jgi:AcrR family transcriptional regulator
MASGDSGGPKRTAKRALPLVRQTPVERADAARNRERILGAAARLVAVRGFAGLSLDEVAREARLGVGTVYRRFGDRAQLMYALLDEQERRFQAAFTAGPPPLGPGAPPLVRIRAFLHALVDQIAAHTDLLLAAEAHSPTARYRSGPYKLHRFHLAILLTQARPGVDARYLADALLAPLSASLVEYQRHDHGATYASIKAGIDDLLGWTLPTPDTDSS